MTKQVAIISSPNMLSKKESKALRKAAQKRLGRGFRVLVVCGGAECKIIGPT